jgi:hypothetical protein
MADRASLIVVATSAPSGRPGYKRDLLNCFCYPATMPVRFTYRKRWIHPDLLAEGALRDKRVLMVFCDGTPEAKEFDFIPLRFGSSPSFAPSGILAGAGPDTRLAFVFDLDAFVSADVDSNNGQFDEWSLWVRGQAGVYRPRPQDPKENPREAYYVFPARDFAGFSAEGNVGQSWGVLGERLTKSVSLNDSTLFRVSSMRVASKVKEEEREQGERVEKAKGGQESKKEEKLDLLGYEKGQYALRLVAGRTYKLALQFVLPETKAMPPPTLKPNASAASLQVSDPLITNVGRVIDANIIVSCARVNYEEWGTLVIEDTEDKPDHITAPRAEFAVVLKPQRWMLPLALFGIFLGALIATISPDSLKALGAVAPWLSWLSQNADLLTVIAKFVGPAVIGLAAYIGFHRMPFGQ